MKAYIIMQKGYEYDDNIYNPTEGGNPTKVFFNKKDAETEQLRLEIKAMKDTSICNYTYSLEDELNVIIDEFTVFLESLNNKYGIPTPVNKWDRFDEFQLNPMATDEECQKYLEMHSIRFYEIAEADIDVASFRDWKIDDILS